jgi:carbon-monoxide dehydrogenase small subunit
VTTIGVNVNKRDVKASIEPRTHLADFLRDHLNLTGTHLGCEHGVCGACTLLIDDMPARSCITLAAACDGARVTTIEGLDEDEIASELRAAFTREHALQCGYCTPGMMISARDLVLRLATADERAIRVGLSGNLCRCTGYIGIVRAVRSVVDNRRKRGIEPVLGAGRAQLGPAGSSGSAGIGRSEVTSTPARVEAKEHPYGPVAVLDFVPDKVFDERFTVAASPDEVFAMFGDLEFMATCLPGATLTGKATADHVEGQFRAKLGPISASFRGVARVEHDAGTMSGRIVGAGSDQRSNSSTQGEIRYHLTPVEDGQTTHVELAVGYSLRGILAQIARHGLVRDMASRLVTDFANNLNRAISMPGAERPRSKPLNGIGFVLRLVKSRLESILRDRRR